MEHNTPFPHHAIQVSAALIFHNGRLLIAQRHAGSHLGGLWEFPGGKREPGETAEQCLIREIREELATDVIVGTLFESITHAYPEKTVQLDFFLCRLAGAEPRPVGCAGLRWVRRLDLDGHEFPAADARLLLKLQDSTGLWD
jgi:8-oxo-dGTP diphosphatase